MRNDGAKSADSPASTPSQLPLAVTPLVPFLPSSSVVSATFLRIVCVWVGSAEDAGTASTPKPYGSREPCEVVREAER